MAALAVCLVVGSTSLAAQDLRCERGDTEVRGLEFAGNVTFSDTELANVIVTTPSAWGRRVFNLPWSARRCLDPAEFANDRLRLILFYRRHGFPNVTVDTARLRRGPERARVRFTVTEGTQTQLRSFVVSGLDHVAGKARVLRDLPVREGERFDRVNIDAAMDTIARRLRNMGYPWARVENVYALQPNADSSSGWGSLADDSMSVVTGPRTRIGRIDVAVTPAARRTQQIPDDVVRQLVGMDSGTVFRERQLADAQRMLYETEAYAHVAIALDNNNALQVAGDSVLLPLSVALVENRMHAARLGVGYGTLDCFRMTTEYDDYNFLKGARRLEVRGRVSKIGIGQPLDGASGACPQARNDPYSTRLNYYLGATLRQPVFLGWRSVPTITAFTSRVSEYNAYVRTTSVGGIASVSFRQSRRSPVNLAYTVDFGRTEAQPALFCAVFNLCAREDRERVQQNQRLAVASVVMVRDGTNNSVVPTHGGMLRLEARHASPAVLSDGDLRFNSVLGDVSRYFSMSDNVVFAVRLRAGAVMGGNFIPPQERMYAGGPTSVRGFRQNELGAVTYTAVSFDTVVVNVGPGNDTTFAFQSNSNAFRRAVPVGGNSLVVANAEFRVRSPVFPDILQLGFFVDAGDVWNRGNTASFEGFRLKVTPGIQLGAITPIGPVRVIVGYNPYPRPSGQLYYENTAAEGGALPCITPADVIALPVRRNVQSGALIQEAGVCPAAFKPSTNKSLRSRLTLSLAIGQAF